MPFRDLLGHHTTLGLLARAIAADTLPPSLVFAGPSGVGKKQAAVAVAQALNCPAALRDEAGPWPVDGCGTCPTCRRIARGMHPDVQLIEPGETGSIKIEPIREVVRQTGYRPFEARRRVIIIDTADALGRDAQDALLKTLEEPPAGSILILVTSVPDQLLPTVRSRCPIVRFAPLEAADVATWLEREGGVDQTRAHAVAAVAGGSLTAALEIAQSGVEGVRASAQRVLERVAGARDPRARLDATREIVGKGRDTGASERESLAVHLQALASLLRDLGVLSTRAGGAALANADLAGPLGALSSAFDADRACRGFGAVDRALSALDRNASPKLVADWLVLQL